MFCTHQPADDEPLSFEKYTIRQKIHFEKYTLEKYAFKNTIKIHLHVWRLMLFCTPTGCSYGRLIFSAFFTDYQTVLGYPSSSNLN